jgi:hypothetical protein
LPDILVHAMMSKIRYGVDEWVEAATWQLKKKLNTVIDICIQDPEYNHFIEPLPSAEADRVIVAHTSLSRCHQLIADRVIQNSARSTCHKNSSHSFPEADHEEKEEPVTGVCALDASRH